MRFLLKISAWIDEFNRYIGMIASVCILLLILVGTGNATVRALSGIETHTWWGSWLSGVGSAGKAAMQLIGNTLNEFLSYLFSAVFMLGSAYVLRKNEHVRVDLFYGSLSHRGKIYVDIFGFIFFFTPVVVLVLKLGWPFFLTSFQQQETSSNAAGLLLWPVKLLMPLSFTCLALQGISEFIKRVSALQGISKIDTSYEKPAQ